MKMATSKNICLFFQVVYALFKLTKIRSHSSLQNV